MEQPSLTLQFYSYGILLHKRTEQGMTEYPVDPGQVAQALAARVTFDTGILSSATVLIRSEGLRRTIVEYRRPQRTGLFLEGTEAPLRVVLPGLILIRLTTGDDAPQYSLYAVKQRPASLDLPLFQAPLPNIFGQGRICWGNISAVSPEALASSSLKADWQMLFGTRFNDHGCAGKSKAFPHDIRQQLIALEVAGKRNYPKRDLIPVGVTLEQALTGERR